MRISRQRRIFWVVMVATLSVPIVAGAQDDAQQRQAVAEAYDRGTAAYLAREYAQAAQWFETAHRLAPTSAALIQAVRAHEHAGHDLRAANLALRLSRLYPDDRQGQRAAQRILPGATRRYGRVNVTCDGCTVDLDGTLLESPEFFVEPGEEHRVSGVFETGTVVQTASPAAGQSVDLSFEAPPPSAGNDSESGGGLVGPEVGDTGGGGPLTGGGSQEVRRDEPEGGTGRLPPAIAISGMAVTAGLLGVTIWSGVDALSGVDAYEAMPTPEALAEGQDKERRTNILIGVTAAVGAATLVLTILTDWSGDDEEEAPVRASALIAPRGGGAVIEGTF